MKILDSLAGNLLGLGKEPGQGNFLKPLLARGGLMVGPQNKEISVPGPNKVVFFDDFLGDVISDQWDAQEGTDSATSAEVVPATTTGNIGGHLLITTGDVGSGLAADMAQMTQALQWQASNGGLVFQIRIKLSAITTCYVFVGFTDLAASLEAPIESAGSANTITTTATDAVGFFFDTRMTDDVWWCAGVKNNTDATHVIATLAGGTTQYAPVADTFETLRVEVDSSGNATFFRNGAQVGRVANAVTAATDLTPTINVSKTSVAASMTSSIDYVYVAMNRAADGTST